MSAENSETETRPENDVSAVNLFVQNLLTTVALAVLKGIMSEFQCWTGRLTEIVQLGWNGFLHAFYLSFDVLRFTLMEAIKILISGSQQVYLLTGLFRMAFILIFNIFKGAVQSFLDYIKQQSEIEIAESSDTSEETTETTEATGEPTDELPSEVLNEDNELDELSLDSKKSFWIKNIIGRFRDDVFSRSKQTIFRFLTFVKSQSQS